ncbi:hypothetical protein FA13DRAFT_1735158 [Coprinellus micaceus]|uniref:Alcohol dehydrogenase-like C-terminal domain-containing protein n=1 Tax=Coprinellus micaceus TaxID=71717 RepID=A0A4Y7T4J9_COPMI|nr:hypothetical protein FA13DRAFT_1735158 [Coprinellus micaceus]
MRRAARFISGWQLLGIILAVQFARLSGFSYVVTSASLKHAEYLKSLGATHIIDQNLTVDEFRQELATIEGLPPLAYAFDAIGESNSSFLLAVAALCVAGTVVTVRPTLEYSTPEGLVLCRFSARKRIPTSNTLYRVLWPDVTRLLETKALVVRRPFPASLNGLRKEPTAAFRSPRSPSRWAFGDSSWP